MLSLPDAEALRVTLAQPIEPTLATILAEVLETAEANGLTDLTHVLVVEAGDTEAAIERELGWSPLVNPIDGQRFGTPAFAPYWSWLRDRDGWFELIHTMGNNGFAFVLLIEDAETELANLCHRYARSGE